MPPPRLPRALLGLVLPPDRRVAIVGELDTEFRRHIAPERGRWRAAAWYWRQAITSLPHALRLRRRRPSIAPAAAGRPHGLWRGVGADVAFGVRLARRRPGYSLAVLATLVLGIGVSAAVISVAYAVLGRPLPYQEPDRLVSVVERQRDRQSSGTLSWQDFLDIRRESRTLLSVAGYDGGSRAITGVDQADRVATVEVTDRFFATIGVTPALGRDFVPADLEPGAPSVAVLVPGAWRQRFGADPAILGRLIQLDGQSTTIVGVLPDDFQFPLRGRAEFFLPLQLSQAQRDRRYFHWMDVIARLRPEVSAVQATDELAAIAGGFAAVDPKYHASSTAVAVPIAEVMVGGVRPMLLAVVVASALLLGLACMNIAGLALSRADARGREMSLRGAIGATRWRLTRQLLVEHAVLAMPAAAIALVLARAMVAAFVAAIPPATRVALPNVDRIGIDPIMVTWALTVAVLATLLFGVAPALRLGDRRFSSAVRAEIGETRSAGRARAAFVATQVAMALVLLGIAGLMLQSVARLASRPHGFKPGGLFTMQISLTGFRGADSVLAAHQRLLAELASLPGTTAAGTIDQLPLDGRGNTGMFRIDGAARDYPEAMRIRTVSDNYFGVMGVPVRAGRGFSDADRRGAPRVLIVNETLARMAFGGQALGQRVTFPFFDGQPSWEIVGIVGDERFDGVDRPMEPAAYFAFGQVPSINFAVVARTTGDPARLEPRARDVARAIAPNAPPYGIRTMDAIVDGSPAVFQRRAALWLLAAFAVTALVLVAIGLYSIVAQTVVAREREIGLRLALGAGAGRVLGAVMRRGLLPAAGGLALGLAGCLAAGQGVSSLLFAIEPTDPGTLTAVAAILAATALLACLVPARRVLRIDPIASLRQE